MYAFFAKLFGWSYVDKAVEDLGAIIERLEDVAEEQRIVAVTAELHAGRARNESARASRIKSKLEELLA